MKRQVEVFDDLEALSRSAAHRIARLSGEVETMSIALSGGSTPQRLFDLLAGEWRDRIPWQNVHLFWVDERFVPADHPDSNFRLAQSHFIDAVPIPGANIHPVPTDLENPSEAASAYEGLLRSFFGREAGSLFDLALLGIGDDGHTASLFPKYDVPPERWVVDVRGPATRPPRTRVSLTFDALNRARVVVFLVAGAGKQEALTRVLEGDPALPASHVRGQVETLFLVDSAAIVNRHV